MLLPSGERAFIDRGKITDYLLSESHPDGRGKAQFFSQHGFRSERWGILADALLGVGVSNPVVGSVQSAYGVRYVVDGALSCPDGRRPTVRTIWILENGSNSPRLVTAYPIEGERNDDS
jgi:hypothetical protein